jgi:hypothetical protein
MASVPSAAQLLQQDQHSICSNVTNPGTKAETDYEEQSDLYGSEHQSDCSVIVQEEDSGLFAGNCNMPAVPVAAAVVSTDAIAVGSHDQESKSSCKQHGTAGATEAQVESMSVEPAAEAAVAANDTAAKAEGACAAVPAGGERTAAVQAGRDVANRVAADGTAGGSSSSSNSSRRIVLPGHSGILCSSSSYCGAVLESWCSSGNDSKAEVLITVPQGEQFQLHACIMHCPCSCKQQVMPST